MAGNERGGAGAQKTSPALQFSNWSPVSTVCEAQSPKDGAAALIEDIKAMPEAFERKTKDLII